MSVALITHPACLGHDAGGWHPECPDRLRVVLRGLEAEAFAPLLREAAPQATREQLCRVHPAAYVDAILALQPAADELIQIDSDTALSQGTPAAILHAAGGAVAAVDAVMDGWARAAFAAIRPPGHHAEPDRAMGFCFFNNAAIAAVHAQARWGLERVAVLDFDVHHGNGTQAAFAANPSLFYGSTHQHPCYPGTGSVRERGVAGNIVNAPLAPGAGSGAFRTAWAERILPSLRAFSPEFIIISAGFDAHKADPLAELLLETEDFSWITREILALADGACRGRVASVLEGGYDLTALAASAAAHVRELMRL
jgi:acetoin utilization deacetylase AcuC-like enzyme